MKLHPPQDYEYETEAIGEIMFTAEQIEQRVYQMGAQISADYAFLGKKQERLLLIGLLKGVVIFMADLLRAITIPVEVDFMDIGHYSMDNQYGGTLDLTRDIMYPIVGRHVLFVEDVIDKGLTLNHLLRNLRARQPATLEVCAMFDKPAYRLIDIPLRYVGYEIQNDFVVGYGLDYQQQYRNLPFLAKLNRSSLPT